jgi:hypothetical protein
MLRGFNFDDYHLLGDDNHHSHRRGNLKSYIKFNFGLYHFIIAHILHYF